MIDPNLTCMRCMSQLKSQSGRCPVCGYDNATAGNAPHQLECRSILAGAYLVGCVLGQGGFGITYTGWDLNLDAKVAIKEYYPLGYAARDAHTHISVVTLGGDKADFYRHGLERFVNEAKTLAKLTRESAIVGVRGFFYENGTAYIVMDFVEGVTLKTYAEQHGGKMPAKEVLRLFRPLCDALARVHDAGLLHRDISPDNIILRPDGTLTLIDFGAARQISANGEHSNTVNVKQGFAPEEQYRTRGEQGPWTDVYALAATIYRLTTGQTPPQALDRLSGGTTITPPRQYGADLTSAQENALLHGLGVNAQFRTKDMRMFIKEFYGESVQPSAPTQNTVQQAPVSAGASTMNGSQQPPQRQGVSQQPVPQQSVPKPVGDQRKKWKTIAIVGGSAVAVYLVIMLAVGGFGTKGQGQRQDISAVQTQAPALFENADVSATEAPSATQPPSLANPGELDLTMDYGQIYECDVRDFDNDYGYTSSQIDWNCYGDIDQVYCSEDGYILAGNVQVDPDMGYNDPIRVVGTAPNGVEFVYNVIVGNGSTYHFDWSNSARVLKDSSSYTFVPSPYVPNCVGFTAHCKYELVSGRIVGDWVLWVHEDNGKWISFGGIEMTDGVLKSVDVTFDHPVTITEFVMQPESQEEAFNCNISYGASDLLFDVGE